MTSPSSIRFKLVLIISVLSVVSLSVLTGSNISSFQSGMSDMALLMNSRTTKLLADKMESEIDRRSRNNLLLADMVALLGGGILRRIEEGFLQKERDLLFYSITDAGGLRSGSIGYSLVNDSLMKQVGLKREIIGALMRQNAVGISKTILGETAAVNVSGILKRPAWALFVPLPDNRAGVAVYLIDQLAAEFLGEKLSDAGRKSGLFHSFLVAGDGKILIDRDQQRILRAENVSQLPIVRGMFQSKIYHGWQKYTDAGRTFLGSYQRLRVSDLGVVTVVSEEKALESVTASRDRSVLTSLFIILLSIVFIYYFSASLSSPLKKLAAGALAIREGRYDTRVETRSRDEIGTLTASFNMMAEGLEEREKLKGAFGKFVNEEMAAKVLKGDVHLGGEQREVTVFFSDIRNFTAISEPLAPGDVVGFLNEYMSRMVEIIHAHGGVVDKYIGDAIMAVWGPPFFKGNHAKACVEAALAMREALISFNRSRGSRNKPMIKIGCGINSGSVLAGQIGSEDRLEYTVIGDAVNLASRLESLNKQMGTDILISASTYHRAGGTFLCHKLQKTKVKGKADAQDVYAVLGEKGKRDTPRNLEELRKLTGIRTLKKGRQVRYIYDFLKD